MTRSLLLAIIFACLSGITYGYDISVIAAALNEMKAAFPSIPEELIVALMSIGILVSRLFAWSLADKFGRIKSLVAADVIILAGIMTTVLTKSAALLLIGRFFLGMGVGTALLVGPTYLSEISPRVFRGRLVTLHELCVCIGSFLGFSSSWALPESSWQVKLGISAIPSLIQLGLTFMLPESPNWLSFNGRLEEAEKSKLRLGLSEDPPTTHVFDLELDHNIDKPPISQPKQKTLNLLRSLWTAHKSPLLISLCVCIAGSACGFYVLQAFAVKIVSRLFPEGDEKHIEKSILPWLGAAKLVGVLICYGVIDLLGRRAVLLASLATVIMSNCLLITSAYIPGWSVIIGIGFGIFGWSLGLGSMTLLVANELMPTEYRATASGIVLAGNSIVEVVYHLTFRLMFDASPALPFIMFLAYSVFAFGVTFVLVPETLGVNLKE